MCEGGYMVNGINLNSSGFKQNSYGNIQRIGASANGRVLYRVIDSNGEEAGRLTVAGKDTDKFEQSYRDIMDAAPKIQKFVTENSSEADIKKRRMTSRLITGAGALAGFVVPIALTRKASTLKQILSTVAGLVLGLSEGFATSLAVTTPPGTYKFAKASRTISKLDIQPVMDKSVN